MRGGRLSGGSKKTLLSLRPLWRNNTTLRLASFFFHNTISRVLF